MKAFNKLAGIAILGMTSQLAGCSHERNADTNNGTRVYVFKEINIVQQLNKTRHADFGYVVDYSGEGKFCKQIWPNYDTHVTLCDSFAVAKADPEKKAKIEELRPFLETAPKPR